MFDWLQKQLLARLVKSCLACGSKRVTVTIVKSPPFIVDGPIILSCRCPTCGHTWCHPIRRSI